ncbi:thioredoxin [Candidatus Parvarchaeota archaeon]|nr:thioredoxin [Candidatus Parvarchaeota archaeon]
MVKELDAHNFISEIGSAGIAVVDFWADWCHPCKQMSPILLEIESELGKEMSFFKVNVDASSDLASRYGIQSIPTILVFKNGEPLVSMIGLLSKNKIISELDKVV